MQTSTSKFRISAQGQDENHTPDINAISPTAQRQGSSKTRPACYRCRTFKKRCSRTLPRCDLCIRAGQHCSFSSEPESTAVSVQELKLRTEWLSNIIYNVTGHDVRGLQTGSDLPEVVQTAAQTEDTQQADTISPSSSAVPSANDGGQDRGAVRRLVRPQPVNADGAPAGARPLDVPPAGSVYSKGRLPHDAAARRFVSAYVKNVHRAYPYLNSEDLLCYLEQMGVSTTLQPQPDSTLFYLVNAVGATSLQRAGHIEADIASRFDVSSEGVLQQALTLEGEMSIKLLLLMALLSLFDPDGPSAWSIVSVAARKAISCGLPDTNSQAQIRLYWSIYVLDRMMSVSLGLPVSLELRPEVPLPGLTIEEFASRRIEHAQVLQTHRSVASLRMIEDKILHGILLVQPADVTRGRRAQILIDIENWYSAGCLTCSSEDDNVPVHNSITWLSARYYYALLLLYFNVSFDILQPGILLKHAQQHLQAQAALLETRQLPLNRVTLYRLFPVALTLLRCFEATGTASADSMDGLGTLRQMLSSFSENWQAAHKAAAILKTVAERMQQAAVAESDRLHMSVFENRLLAQRFQLESLMQHELGASTCFVARPDEMSMTWR